MNVQDCIIKAIEGDSPDHVPIFIPGFDSRFRENFDAASKKRDDGKACIVNGQDITPLVSLGVDLCEVQGPPHVKEDFDLPKLEASDLRVDMYGRVFKRGISGNMQYFMYQGPYLRTEEQLARWDHVIPREIEAGWQERVYKETIEAVDKHAICPVFKACDGLYSILEEAIGVVNMAMLLHDNPEAIDTHLERIYRVVASDVNALLEARIAFICINDDITVGNRPSITPDLVFKHLRPLYKQLVDKIHAAGGKAFFRTTGDVLNVTDTIVAAGFDAIHITNPDPAYLEEFLVTWGDKACAVGNFDVMSMLSHGTPVQVQKRAREIVSNCERNFPRYIFGTNDVLPGSTKLENVRAMIIAVRQHGKL
nr:uroporphyrinogen decarboxylase family protein [Candidatus Sigynarchaeum springense]